MRLEGRASSFTGRRFAAKLGEYRAWYWQLSRFLATSDSRTRRKEMESLAAEADAARRDPVACQRSMVGW